MRMGATDLAVLKPFRAGPIAPSALAAPMLLSAGLVAGVAIVFVASLAVAHDCYHSPEYQRAAAIRQKVADGEIVLVEGF